MNARRMTSRRVALTTAFLTLAAGGTAACDSSSEEEVQDETFYCATDDGTVVDEDNCDNDDDRVRPVGGGFFLWHSVAYAAGYATGTKLPPGGSRFAYNDRAARQAYGLPATGPVANGTVKTNVVGQGGDGTSRSKSSGG